MINVSNNLIFYQSYSKIGKLAKRKFVHVFMTIVYFIFKCLGFTCKYKEGILLMRKDKWEENKFLCNYSGYVLDYNISEKDFKSSDFRKNQITTLYDKGFTVVELSFLFGITQKTIKKYLLQRRRKTEETKQLILNGRLSVQNSLRLKYVNL